MLVGVVGWLVGYTTWIQPVAGEPSDTQNPNSAPSGAEASPGGSASVAPGSPAPGAPSSVAPADSAGSKPAAGGYSWKDPKPKAKRAKRRSAAKSPKAAALDLNKPLATYPGFMMLPDGRSVVWLYLSRSVSVRALRRGQTYVIDLPEVQVGVQNNTNPLETAHFRTPLSRALLRRVQGGAELVLALREPVVPKHELLAGPGGTMVLRVTLPKAKTQHVAETSTPIPAAATSSTQSGGDSGATGGPGPRP